MIENEVFFFFFFFFFRRELSFLQFFFFFFFFFFFVVHTHCGRVKEVCLHLAVREGSRSPD